MEKKRGNRQRQEPPITPQDEALTAHTLIDKARVSEMLASAGPRKIRALVERGEFGTYVLGGRTVYVLAEVVAYVERVKAKPGRAAWRGHVGVQG